MAKEKTKEKLRDKITPESVVKGGFQLVAGVGASTVAYYAIKAVTPPVFHPVEKVIFKVGAVVVESIAYSVASKTIGDTMDEINAQTDAMMDEAERRAIEAKEEKPKKRKIFRKKKDAVLA